MNMPSDVMSESRVRAEELPATSITPIQRMYWSVRRELWENRSIYLAPLAVAALILLGILISAIKLRAMMHGGLVMSPERQHAFLEQPLHFVAFLIMGATFLVSIFYCLDALHGERRDRSILFWKSLPVSDMTTVLSKVFIPLVVLPLLTFAITVVTQVLMLLICAFVLMGSGVSLFALLPQLGLFPLSLMLLFHLVAIHGLWYAPIYAWLMLVSGWARRAAFLWAVLPPLAIAMLEKIAFGTSHFAAMLGNRLSGGTASMSFKSGMASMDSLAQLHVGEFLANPGLWMGLAVAAAFLAAAVQLRHHRGPM